MAGSGVWELRGQILNHISNVISFSSHHPPASRKVFPHPPTSASPPWHSPTLGHQAFTGPRASPPIDTQQGHPLLYIQITRSSSAIYAANKVILCYICCWSHGSLHVYSGSFYSHILSCIKHETKSY